MPVGIPLNTAIIGSLMGPGPAYIVRRMARLSVLSVAALCLAISLLVIGCGGTSGDAGGQTGAGSSGSPSSAVHNSERSSFVFSGQSCNRFAPAEELGVAIGRPVRFEPTSGGSESRGWACWYYTGDVELNDLLVDAYRDVAQGRRMVQALQQVSVPGVTGQVYLNQETYSARLMVLKSNGFFYVDSSVSDGRYDLLLDRDQLIAVARVVDRHLSKGS